MTNHNLFYDKKLTVMLYSTDEYRLWGPYTVDPLNKQMVLQSNYNERWWFLFFIASLKEVKVFHQDICNLLCAIEFDIRFFLTYLLSRNFVQTNQDAFSRKNVDVSLFLVAEPATKTNDKNCYRCFICNP